MGTGNRRLGVGGASIQASSSSAGQSRIEDGVGGIAGCRIGGIGADSSEESGMEEGGGRLG